MPKRLTPVDRNRVLTLLDDQRLAYDSQGSNAWSVSTNNGNYLWNLENPQILQIRSQWRGVAITAESSQKLREVISVSNANRTAPKAFTLPLAESGETGLVAECNILTHGGLTQQQFYDFCETSLAAIVSFFHEVEAKLPELVTWE